MSNMNFNLLQFGEEHTEWVPIFRLGSEVDHPNGPFTIDGEFVSTFISSFNDFYGDRDYKPPILRNHDDKEGVIYGLVSDLRLNESFIEAEVRWAAGMKELREDGKIRNFSPSFHLEFEDPHSDNSYELLLREISFVGIPHLKDLEPPTEHHYSLLEAEKSDYITVTLASKEPTMKAKEDKDRMDALEAALEELQETVSSLVESDEDGDEDDEEKKESENQEEGADDEKELSEMTPVTITASSHSKKLTPSEDESNVNDKIDALIEQNQQLQERIAHYERKDLRSDLSEKIQDLDDETFEDLVALKETNQSLFDKTVKRLSEVITVNGPKGRTGNPTQPGQPEISLAEAKKKAEEKGLKGPAKLDYLQELGVLS